jgi:hypothetical protein
MVIPDSVIEQLKGYVQHKPECQLVNLVVPVDVTCECGATYASYMGNRIYCTACGKRQLVSGSPSCTCGLDTLLSTLLAAPRDQGPIHQRVWDLVRFCRSELSEADLITQEEYAWLCYGMPGTVGPPGQGSPSPRRLETYDELRERVEKAEAQLAQSAPRDQGDAQESELLVVLKEIVEALRREAPGTPLNNHQFDALGARANAVIARAERAASRSPEGTETLSFVLATIDAVGDMVSKEEAKAAIRREWHKENRGATDSAPIR